MLPRSKAVQPPEDTERCRPPNFKRRPQCKKTTSKTARGRPCSVPIQRIQAVLECHRYEVVDEDGSLVRRSSQIWKDISQELQDYYPITPTALHILLSTNRYGIWENFFQKLPEFRAVSDDTQKKMIPVKTSSEKSVSSSGSSSDASGTSTDVSTSEKIIEKFTLTFSKEEWASIAPEDVVYRTSIVGGRKYERHWKVLRRGVWTNLVHEHVVLHTKLKCNMRYNGGKISISSEPYVMVNGECSSCRTKFEGVIVSPPILNARVIMICTLEKSSEICSGIDKRQLRGSLRKIVIDKMTLEKKSPSLVQKELAKNFDSSVVPSLEVLRKAKSDSKREQRFDNDPILAVVMAKYVPPYNNFIKDVCYDKLIVHFWSASQIHAERKYCSGNPHSRLSIDATGQVVKRVIRPNGERSSHVMLFEIVIHDREKKSLYPVGSMLSEKQDTETIRHWLNVWMKDGALIPKEVVIDMSLALTNACIQSFANMSSLAEYLSECGKILNKETEKCISLPASFIRYDVAHMMKLFSMFSSLRNQLKRTRHFYLKSLALLVQCENLNEMRDILKCIFTVCLSESEGDEIETGAPTPCEESKSYLLQRIAGVGDSVLLEEYTQGEEENEGEEEEGEAAKLLDNGEWKKSKYGDEFRVWVQDIVNNVRTDIEGSRGNQQFLPKLVDNIINVSKTIPLWTAIMVSHYGFGKVTASSTGSEGHFNNLKNRLFHSGDLPARLDEFLLTYITAISGQMEIKRTLEEAPITNNKMMKNVQKVCSICDDEPVDEDRTVCSACSNLSEKEHHRRLSSKHLENWRGLAMVEARKRKSHLEPNADWLHIDLSSEKKYIPIGMLKNGNITTLQPVKIGDKSYVLTNTCAFDAIFQIVAAAYCDSILFMNKVEAAINKWPLGEMIRDVIKKGVTMATYRKRATILTEMKNISHNLGISTIHAECNVSAVMIPLVFKDFPSGYENRNCSSPTCPSAVRTMPIFKVEIGVPKDGIKQLQQCIENYFSRQRATGCFERLSEEAFKTNPNNIFDPEISNYPLCGGTRALNFNLLKTHLVLDIIEDNDEKLSHCSFKLCDVPKQLILQDEIFHLRGIIGFQGFGSDVNTVGHYRAYCLRLNDKWEMCDDLKEKPSHISSNEKIDSCHSLIYTI